MGTLFSSNRDYNRVLLTQPRTSIEIPKFEPSKSLPQQPPANSFSIPTPMRISQSKNQNKDTTSTLPNTYFKPIPTLQESIPSPTNERTNSSTVLNHVTRQKSREDQSQQQIIARNTSYPLRSNLPTYTHPQRMTGDTAAISRSVMNLNEQQGQTKSHFSPTSRPFRTIVERNGQQFLVEFKERTEQRYIQWIDETTHQKRLFEVTDRIPFRTIRPYKYKSQYLSQNDISQNTSLPTFRSHQRSQYNKANVPFTNKTSPNTQYVPPTTLSSPQSAPIPPLTTKKVANSVYQHAQYSQASSLQTLSTGPKNVSDQYSSKLLLTQSPLFRAHTPTISDNSASSSTSNSSDSDEETETDNNKIIARILRTNENLGGYEQINPSFINNQNSTAISYETYDGYSASTSLDPFGQPLNSSNHQNYRKQSTIQNYVEPVLNNERFQQCACSNCSLVPIAIKQPNHSQYSHSTVSQKSVYDG